jgi:hypothetical protein
MTGAPPAPGLRHRRTEALDDAGADPCGSIAAVSGSLRPMRSIDQLIASNAALRQLGGALARRDDLLRRVRRALPGDLAPHCVAAELDGPALRLLADSGSWATRLRYLARDLRESLRAEDLIVSAVEVRVLPPDARTERAAERAPVRSKSAATCLEQAADGIEDDALRAALRRLGRRLRR